MNNAFKYSITSLLISIFVIIISLFMYSKSLDQQSFARACNDSGGIARNIDGMLQCVGEKP